MDLICWSFVKVGRAACTRSCGFAGQKGILRSAHLDPGNIFLGLFCLRSFGLSLKTIFLNVLLMSLIGYCLVMRAVLILSRAVAKVRGSLWLLAYGLLPPRSDP